VSNQGLIESIATFRPQSSEVSQKTKTKKTKTFFYFLFLFFYNSTFGSSFSIPDGFGYPASSGRGGRRTTAGRTITRLQGMQAHLE
jgi:hypothetical protein